MAGTDHYTDRVDTFAGRSALVIEDDDIRGLLEIVLGQMGFEVSVAETGGAGLALARSGADLITLDIGLPDRDGIDVLRELRTFHQGTVVMLTARDQSQDMATATAAGADAYLVKPFRPRSLRTDLAAILAR